MKYKNKNTEEIVTLCSITWSGSEGTVYCTINSKGIKNEYKEDVFKNTYEPISIDFEDYIDKLAPLKNLSREFEGFLNVVARRNTPGGYFHVGDIVYFIGTGYLSNGSTKPDDVYQSLSGPENPYTIIKIEQGEESRIFYIYLSYGVNTLSGKYDEPRTTIRVPYYIDLYDSRDAFFTLSRYDMPY